MMCLTDEFTSHLTVYSVFSATTLKHNTICSLSLLCALLRGLTELITLQASFYSKPCLLWAVHSP